VWWKWRGGLTTEALQALGRHPPVLADVVGTQLVDDTGDGHGVRQQLGRLPHLPVLVERIEVARVQVCVPARHVHQDLLHLRLGELELAEEAPTAQVVIVLVALPQHVADLQVCLVVVRPVLLAAVHRDAAVGALEVYVGGRGARRGRLAGFEVHGVVRRARRLVRGVRAVGMLAHKRRALPYLRDGRVAEGVEEVVPGQDQLPPYAFRVHVLIRLEGLRRGFARRRGEAAPGEGRLWWCRLLGGVSALRCAILGERAERLRRSELRPCVLDQRQTLSAHIRRSHRAMRTPS
jgi:hypothetical protein